MDNLRTALPHPTVQAKALKHCEKQAKEEAEERRVAKEKAKAAERERKRREEEAEAARVKAAGKDPRYEDIRERWLRFAVAHFRAPVRTGAFRMLVQSTGSVPGQAVALLLSIQLGRGCQ